MAANGQPLYRVSQTPLAARQLKELGVKATSVGKKQALIDALKSAVGNLKSDPLNWGEAKHRTMKKNGWVCYGFCPPIWLRYAVYEDEKIVMILRIEALARSGIE